MLGEIGVVNQDHIVESRSEATLSTCGDCAAECVGGQRGSVNRKA